jgi:hypothetical protein
MRQCLSATTSRNQLKFFWLGACLGEFGALSLNVDFLVPILHNAIQPGALSPSDKAIWPLSLRRSRQTIQADGAMTSTRLQARIFSTSLRHDVLPMEQGILLLSMMLNSAEGWIPPDDQEETYG